MRLQSLDRIASRPRLMMTAAEVEDAKERKKLRLPPDAKLPDRQIPGARFFGMGGRGEIAGYLIAVYDCALKLDAENERNARVKNSVLRQVVDALKSWITNPAQPLGQTRRTDPVALMAYDAPRRKAAREARMAEITATLNAAVERNPEAVVARVMADVAKRKEELKTAAVSATVGPSRPEEAPPTGSTAQVEAKAPTDVPLERSPPLPQVHDGIPPRDQLEQHAKSKPQLWDWDCPGLVDTENAIA